MLLLKFKKDISMLIVILFEIFLGFDIISEGITDNGRINAVIRLSDIILSLLKTGMLVVKH